MKKIYVLDDEAEILAIIRRFLQQESYHVETFSDSQKLLKRVAESAPDMFILDIMLPTEPDGFQVCVTLRQRLSTPIIFLSAKSQELDRIMGLELGADDYLTKPFSPRELVARVKAIFRRLEPEAKMPEEDITYKGLSIFPQGRTAYFHNQEIRLTSKEYDLLTLLLDNVNRAFSRQQLLDLVWGPEYFGNERAVDDLVKRVRKKLREAGAPVLIATVWGYGYKIQD